MLNHDYSGEYVDTMIRTAVSQGAVYLYKCVELLYEQYGNEIDGSSTSEYDISISLSQYSREGWDEFDNASDILSNITKDKIVKELLASWASKFQTEIDNYISEAITNNNNGKDITELETYLNFSPPENCMFEYGIDIFGVILSWLHIVKHIDNLLCSFYGIPVNDNDVGECICGTIYDNPDSIANELLAICHDDFRRDVVQHIIRYPNGNMYFILKHNRGFIRYDDRLHNIRTCLGQPDDKTYLHLHDFTMDISNIQETIRFIIRRDIASIPDIVFK